MRLAAFFFSGRLIVIVTTSADHTDEVGFNPFRPHRTSNADYLMVAAAIVIAVLLVLWAAGAL